MICCSYWGFLAGADTTRSWGCNNSSVDSVWLSLCHPSAVFLIGASWYLLAQVQPSLVCSWFLTPWAKVRDILGSDCLLELWEGRDGGGLVNYLAFNTSSLLLGPSIHPPFPQKQWGVRSIHPHFPCALIQAVPDILVFFLFPQAHRDSGVLPCAC